MAAAQRSRNRNWLRRQPWTAPGHSAALQPAGNCNSVEPRTLRRALRAALQLRLYRRGPSGCEATFSCTPIQLPDGSYYQANYEGGNVDLRVPYIGYAAESISYTAAGIDDYNALQVHIDKRMSHGLQVAASYTWSHALDEQSGLGLFYNGNNPLNLRSGYGSADFDRTHVFNLSYVFQFHNFAKETSLEGKFIDGWSLVGMTVLQSGQPYSVVDYTGSVGSIYYSTANGITNPIVPLASGCTAKQALDRRIGAHGLQARKRACLECKLLYDSAAGAGTSGRTGRRHSRLRSIRNRIRLR